MARSLRASRSLSDIVYSELIIKTGSRSERNINVQESSKFRDFSIPSIIILINLSLSSEPAS